MNRIVNICRIRSGFGILALASIASCGVVPGPASPLPDSAAVRTVIKDIYSLEGQSRMVFLGCEDDQLGDGVITGASSELENDLRVMVRLESEAAYTDPDLPLFTPVWPQTGEAGVVFRLGRFRQQQDGSLGVSVWWNRSCGERGSVDYTLVRSGEQWVIAARQPKPDIMGCY